MNKFQIKEKPAFQRLEAELRGRIVRGEWSPGNMLPSRKALALEYGVNLETLQRAIAPLIDEGTLRADNRRGTFVSEGCVVAGSAAFSSNDKIVAVEPAQRQMPNMRINAGHSSNHATIGIIASSPLVGNGQELDNGWVKTIVGACERFVSQSEGSTQLFNRYRFGADWYRVADGLTSLLNDSVDAIIVVEPFGYSGLVDELLSVPNPQHVPIVSISWEELDSRLPNVYYDSQLAGFQAAQHLIRTGRHPLLFVAPFADETDWLEERILAARKAVRQSGLPADMLHVFRCPEQDITDLSFTISSDGVVGLRSEQDRTIMPGYMSARAAFDQESIFTPSNSAKPARWGIIAPNDAAAYGIIRAASDIGKTMGIDYGIVGFDDLPVSSVLGLTSVRPPLEALGEEAVKLVLRLLKNDHSSNQVRLRSHLISRASTKLG